MNESHQEKRPTDQARHATGVVRLLEQLTGAVLGAVVLGLAWMLLAAYQPQRVRLASETAEVAVALVLLTSSLVLVTVVALLHTRRQS
ncbi:MAG: hypothetical protein AB7O62_00670 [Pirellulales bacterium]